MLVRGSAPPGLTPEETTRLAESVRKHLAAMAPANREQLYRYFGKIHGFWIARTAVCPEHDPPFEFVARAFFQEYSHILAMAAKGSGKTRDLSLLHHANSRFKPGCWTTHMGATAEQAKIAHDYMRRELARSEFAGEVDGEPLLHKTIFKNGSQVDVKTGTLAQASGPHPHIAAVDEFDQLDWETWVHYSKTPMGTATIKPQVILASTRFRKHGPVNRVMQDMGKVMNVVSYCTYEAMAPCTRDCHNTQLLDGSMGPCPLYERLMPDGTKVPHCAGKAHKSTGHETWETVVGAFVASTLLDWQVIQEIKEPGTEGSFLSELGYESRYFKPEYVYVPGRDVYLGNDAGFGTSAMGAWQVDPQTSVLYQFDEIYLHDATVDGQIDVLRSKPWVKDCRYGWSDPEDPAWAVKLREFFYNTIGRTVIVKADNARIPGWREMHRRLWGPHGEVSVGWNSTACPNTKRDLQGLMKQESNPEDCVKKDDHGADQARYLVYNLSRYLDLALALRDDAPRQTGLIEAQESEQAMGWERLIAQAKADILKRPGNKYTDADLARVDENTPDRRLLTIALRDILEEGTMKGRLRRAGLLNEHDPVDLLDDME